MPSVQSDIFANSDVDEVRAMRDWVVACGRHYWPQGREKLVLGLSQPPTGWIASRACEMVELPAWASEVGVGAPAALLVDRAAIIDGPGSLFERCNWLAAAFMFLTGAQEDDTSENSYSRFVGEIDERLFDRAWVNRYMMLLRKLVARDNQRSEDELFGPLPKFQIDLTHDVDAIRKTPEIRLKQSAFLTFNAARLALNGEWRKAQEKASQSLRFLTTTPSYQTIERMCHMESEAGLRSTFHIYGGAPGLSRKSPTRMLIDPGYDAETSDLQNIWRGLLAGGWQIGVHPSFHSFRDADAIRTEAETAARACGQPITRCRQHWLRFSWKRTWQAQATAGLKLDTTLGFNDRPSFRNGSALSFHPWDSSEKRALSITAIPMIFMDSHFYDYQAMTAEQRRKAMRYWIDEIQAVGGQGSVNWHPHTLSTDYGWGDGFRDLLDLLAGVATDR